ncbi:MAG: ABC transporter ATP-binding protein, partial [Ilumatobacteraceae bacterium]
LRMLAGFEIPTEGRILLEGEPVEDVPPYERNVNMVFQSYALFDHLDIADNVAFGLRRRKVPKDEIARRVSDALELVNLSERANARTSELSGGQRQRVALARALVNRPKVLLLDEPLGALDAKLRKHLQGDLAALQRDVGITFVYVTHDQEEALTMSHRLAVMDAGRVAQVGTPVEVYERPATAYVADFLGIANLLDAVADAPRDGRQTVHVGTFDLDARGDAAPGPVKLVIRPERVRVEPGASIGANRVPAMVDRLVYVGSTTQVHVRLPDGQTIQSLIANQEEPPTWPPGTPVAVTLPPDALRSLPT